MFDKTKHILFSLRLSIISILVGLFVITTVLILSIRWVIFSNELTYTSLTLMRYVSNQVLIELTSGLKPVEIAGKFSANLFESGVLQNNQSQLTLYTYYLVKTIPLVEGVYWGDEQGNFIQAKKEMNGSITTNILLHQPQEAVQTTYLRDTAGNIIKTSVKTTNVTYDPRTRPWYREAKTQRKTTWTDIYKFYANPRTGISVGAPVFTKEGQLLGVFGLDVTLDYLNDFITNQEVSKHGYSFIITEKENLIAFPHKQPFIKASTSPSQLINLRDISFPLIEKSLNWYKKTGQKVVTLDYQGEAYLCTYQPVPEFSKQGWLIGVITERSDFTSFLEIMNWSTLFISFITLMICILIVSKIITKVVKPINLLVEETDKIKHFELDEELHVQSRIKEVIDLRDAISSMKKGLKQFQKYVPKLLVQQLIESGEEIRVGGMRKQVVVFFSDIENFTSIAEKMDPNELMEQICQYFDVLSDVIISQKGTIDKYIGDSLMAFWGAPLSITNPCDYAAKAALLCQKKVEELNHTWAKQGKLNFKTRIGIHKGEAIVGNVGSSERLNYTALGDTINISSRLEKINKIYKTTIIVSDSVYEEIKDRFILRRIDTVMVTGRTTAIDIYELLGEKDKEQVPKG